MLFRSADALPDIMNDPSVYMNVSTPPYPYHLAHGQEYVRKMKEASAQVFRDMDGKNKDDLVEGFPVQVLREVKPDGSEVFIGIVDICRYRFADILDSELRKTMIAVNEEKRLGDPDIVWELMGECQEDKLSNRRWIINHEM